MPIRAIWSKPELLLADEPTAALDSVMGRKVMELLKQVAHEHNTGVLVVTHDHRAIDVFDRIRVMKTAGSKKIRNDFPGMVYYFSGCADIFDQYAVY